MNDVQSQAEALAAAIDRLTAQEPAEGVTAADPALLAVVERLWRTAPQAMIDPHVRTRLRRRLVRLAASTIVRYSELDSIFGPLYVAHRGRAACAVGLAVDERTFQQRCLARFGSQPLRDTPPPTWLVTAVHNHLTGRRAFKGAIDLLGLTPFQQRVLTKAREIPRGEVRPYSWIAREVGFPQAVRAVGSALGKNPMPLLIPCHRVVRSEGTLGAYSAGNPTLKKRILDFEGVDLGELQTLRRLGKRFRGSRNTRIFCLPTCYSRKWAKERHTVFFASAAEARQSGYRPCKLCRPA